MYYQHAKMTTAEYVKFFTALVDVVETFGGLYGLEPGLFKDKIKFKQGLPVMPIPHQKNSRLHTQRAAKSI
jgi:hypothetical protein